MYTAQYKSTFNTVWTAIGTYSAEGQAINEALRKKNSGAFAARVIDRSGNVVYSC
ncbi:hypothetical protein [Pseudidiomarina mangrovi]|uniref:hypothetical protein n=1 Tax=Pseudidiomarina mangrovi TaxID=2487133 RepID=UPI0013DF8824|nr:hypothetical protein [Pseudidiomarina mangrovi]